jgi:hypothetical protein
MLWGHEVSTYLCVDSLGFQGLSQYNKITMNVNVRSTTIQSRSFEEKHLQDHEETIIHTLVVNLPIAYSTTSPRNNTFKKLRYHLQETKIQDKS